MNEPAVKPYATYILPSAVVSRLDMARLVREVEAIDNALTEHAVRTKVGQSEAYTPSVSDELNDFLQANEIEIDANSSQSRMQFIGQLRLLKDRAPVMHMTFAVEADKTSLRQFAQWLRESVHPQAVIEVGLQPGLVAGVYLRTPNHVHDLSLRAALAKGRSVLVEELGALRGTR